MFRPDRLWQPTKVVRGTNFGKIGSVGPAYNNYYDRTTRTFYAHVPCLVIGLKSLGRKIIENQSKFKGIDIILWSLQPSPGRDHVTN